MAWELYRSNRTLGEVRSKGHIGYLVFEDIKAHENVGWWYEDWNGIDTVEAWQHHMGYAFDRLELSDKEYAQLMLFVCNIGESMDSMFSEGFTYELAKFFDGVYRYQNGLEE